MITHSGIHIQKIGGVIGTPTSEDIAVQSGRVCRYAGSVWMPLLAHLVFVGLLAYKRSKSTSNLAWGFLHDAHEIVTSDIPSPFKCDCIRVEQKAIDERLMAQYHLAPKNIDFALIKECDIIALDIEAVELGLPGFADTEIRYSTNRRLHIHNDASDVALFHRILDSPFYTDTIRGKISGGVARFFTVLRFMEQDKYEPAFLAVEHWELLRQM